jgi:hypothetical protein
VLAGKCQLTFHLDSNDFTSWVCAPFRLCVAYLAGVGKQAEKLSYEHFLRQLLVDAAKIFCNAVARGPGDSWMGAGGGGEGEAASVVILFTEWTERRS